MSHGTASGLDTPRGEDWRYRARCRGADPELFYPVAGRGVLAPESGDHVEAAKRVCARCSVREACLNWALAVGDRWGICGWTTPGERYALSRMLKGVVAATCSKGHDLDGFVMRPDGTGAMRCRACDLAGEQRRAAAAKQPAEVSS